MATKGKAKGKKAAGATKVKRRGKPQKPRPEMPLVPYPDAQMVPDWSTETLHLLHDLSPKEQAFVQRVAAGDSACEAYRRAYNSDSDSAKQAAWKIRHRHDVQLAITACLKDRNVGNRCDREWLLSKLMIGIEICSAYPDPDSQLKAGELVMKMAKLKGEVSDREPTDEEGADGAAEQNDFADRVDRILTFAEGFIRGAKARIDGGGRGGNEDGLVVKVDAARGPAGGGNKRPV